MSSLSVLGLVQEFCGLQGLPVPTALVGSNESSVVQYRAIAQAVVREAGRAPWQEKRIRGTFTTVATASQGALSTLFPGFEAFVPGTLWLESETLPVRGPLTDSSWAALTALEISGPPYSYWLSAGLLYLTPTPPAGLTASALYTTDWLYYDGSSPQQMLSADSNTVLIPDDVFLMGFEAFWRKAKGLAYSNEFNLFQDRIGKALAPTLPTLALDNSPEMARPMIFIPPGSWMTS